MLNPEQILTDAQKLFAQLLAEREGVPVEQIIPLGGPSPGLEALARVLIAAINKELQELP